MKKNNRVEKRPRIKKFGLKKAELETLARVASLSDQNRRQKVFNRKALRLCKGLDVLKFD